MQNQNDPLEALGSGLASLVESVMGSGLPDEVKEKAKEMMDYFQLVAEAVKGGAPAAGPQPAPGGGSPEAGGNPNAVPVR